MLVFRHIEPLRSHLNRVKRQGHEVGFVPTMGALHQGHMSLIEMSANAAKVTVASVYVNPTQFNAKADFDKYPRTVDQDLGLLERNGCDIVWLPNDREMYPNGKKVEAVDYGTLTKSIEGHYRPGHFDGMVTVVRSLLKAVNPDKAFFGEKDFQQLAIIRELNESEHLGVQIVGCPIVREASGLAMSSRNRRMSDQQQNQARRIYSTLQYLKSVREHHTPREMEAIGLKMLNDAEGVEPEYLVVVDAKTFEQRVKWEADRDFRVLVAAYVGPVRLIDNISI